MVAARCRRARAVASSSPPPDRDSQLSKKSTEFGYSRKDVLLIGGGLIGLGYAMYYGLQAIGVSPGMAGNVVQLVIFLGICIGWISSYLFRVANKDMTYVKQLEEYENAVMQKRLEEMPETERERLLEESDFIKSAATMTWMIGQGNDAGPDHAQQRGQAVQLGLDLRFSNSQLERDFKREQAETYQYVDAGWAVLSTMLVILLLPRLFARAEPWEVVLASTALPVAALPVYVHRHHQEFWLRQRGKLLGASRLYKSMLAIILSKYYVPHMAVTAWLQLFRYLLLNGRVAVLLHLAIGMRVSFFEFLIIQVAVVAMLVPLAPHICMVDTPHGGAAHKLFIRMRRLLSSATSLLSVDGLTDSPDHACVTVLLYLQILAGIVVPGLILYLHERAWRFKFAAQHGAALYSCTEDSTRLFVCLPEALA
ncbi:hypothetical protein WJX72_011140 [[Myrmecia] bisecta]|uniref:Uncharacterized protein n=1 Tax=[Myrmecia] bisecta TaxID=41462 RepID=A0AAW1QTF8_9CHLO